MLQQMQLQQALQGLSQKPSNPDQSAGGAANSSDAQQGSQSTAQDATYQTGGSQAGAGTPASQNPTMSTNPTTSTQPAVAGGNQFPTKTIDGVPVQMAPVVSVAVGHALSWPNGCDAYAAYGNTAGDPSKWAPADPNDLHTGDVIAWDDRAAIIVREGKGVFMINNGKPVPLDTQAWPNFRGCLHPPVPFPPDTTQPVAQNITNQTVTAGTAAT